MEAYFVRKGGKFLGRPITTLPNVLNKDLSRLPTGELRLKTNKDLDHLRSIAQDRPQWKGLTKKIREAAEASRRLLVKMFSDVVHLSHSRFHYFHNFILPVAIFVFFLSVCVAADVDAEVSIGDDNDDGGSYNSDDFATHVEDDDDKI
ncbi:hypothetical protein ElyMa_002348300 [Elysia marginata]|uniref:Uncharacterized protein n=1 Tax=Elysia marginata TaxID=1093978 RepID=A0AAV4G8F6_9GAST|nr:hypothetical protein ElyMa_002348300 [Elysia marginata]